MLGILPFVVVFPVTSIAMLRERTALGLLASAFARGARPQASTQPWSTTTSAARTSCSWPRSRRRPTPPACCEVLAGGPDNLGENVVRLLLHVWDGPMRPAALALVRSAVAHEWTAKLLREFLVSQILRRVVGPLGLPTAERGTRGSLAASQLIGLVMARYMLKVDPPATASPETIVAAVGPTVQRYLTGDVELPGR